MYGEAPLPLSAQETLSWSLLSFLCVASLLTDFAVVRRMQRPWKGVLTPSKPSLEAHVDWVGHGLQNRCAESSFVGGFDSRALPSYFSLSFMKL